MTKLIRVKVFDGVMEGREMSVNPEQIVKIEDVMEETGYETIFDYSLMTLTDGTTYKLEKTSAEVTQIINESKGDVKIIV